MPEVVEPTVDPVCGMEVDENKSPRFSHKGKTYFFCSIDCKEEFEADPEAYIDVDGGRAY